KESISDTSFGTIRRDNVPAHINDWRELGWKEEPSPIYPMLHFVGLEEENKSVFMLAKGIKEYEVLENSNIALTLFRGVGFLGKPDLIRRPGIASGNEFRYIETPDSQLKEKLKFKFAITINNEVNITKINKIWKNYSITIPNYQIQEINRFTNTLKYFVMHPLKDKLEEVKNIVDCNDLNDIVVTSIIPVDKNSFTVRFVNYTDKVIDGGNIKVSKGKSYEWVNMNNKEISNKENIDSSINIGKFKSGEIKTLKINI
ncbi:MAG: glycoside hydrolase family 38 C-terminal domain-containing protein, partial [Clostridium sp.]|nr:glycoside hydrolase family 38 C-terminal domain-containing protein [Clostridium sp.]